MTNRLLVVTISTLLIVGCQKGPKLGEVSGVVTFEGKPLEKATVTFTPVDGQMSFDRTEADGSYQLQFADGRPGAMLGENVVSIETDGDTVSGVRRVMRATIPCPGPSHVARHVLACHVTWG